MIRDSLSVLTILLFAAILWRADRTGFAACWRDQSPGLRLDRQRAYAGNHPFGRTFEIARRQEAESERQFELVRLWTCWLMATLLIPRNTKIIGHVTEAKAHSKQSPGAVVGIAFDKALMKDGRELPLQAAVQAVGRPLQTAPAFPQDDPMAATATGMPSASQSQRGSVTGASTGTQFPNPSGYPPGGGAGLPPDQGNGSSSTVSPLAPTSKGVVGIKGLSLDSSGTASVLSSKTDNVRLDSGAQLILCVQ